jgi:hypothetical protein
VYVTVLLVRPPTSEWHGPGVRPVGVIKPHVLPVEVIERGDSKSGDVGLVQVIPQRHGCFDGAPDSARSALDDGPPPVLGVEGDVGDGIGGVGDVGDDPRCAGAVSGVWRICVVTQV